MKLLDLFSGIGGFSLAAHSLGMDTLAFCECEPYPVRVLQRHFPGVPVFPDVRFVHASTDGVDCDTDSMLVMQGLEAESGGARRAWESRMSLWTRRAEADAREHFSMDEDDEWTDETRKWALHQEADYYQADVVNIDALMAKYQRAEAEANHYITEWRKSHALADAAERYAQGGKLPPREPQGDDRRVPQQHRGGGDSLCLTAGFPCQDLSYAGKGAGLEGERSGLYGEVIRLVRDLSPEWVLLENVNAILTRGVGVVLGELASCGYGWAYGCVPACAVGAPHRRDRWWAVAWPTLGDEEDRRRGERIWSSVLSGITPFGDNGWSTPTGDDANNVTRASGEFKSLTRDVQSWPTPNKMDAQGHGTTGGGHHQHDIDRGYLRGVAVPPDAVGQGSLNPDWVDALMGYPIGYTLPEGEPLLYLPGEWPAGRGAPQHPWEPPRLTTVKENRAARLKALGNSIVPRCALLWLRAIQEEQRNAPATCEGVQASVLSQRQGQVAR